MKKIVVLDNYDSFTYNLVYAIEAIMHRRIDVFRNDQVSVEDLEGYDKILLSPGPGVPDEAGMMKDLIMKLAPEKSILGVCLGHQGIAEVFGGSLINIERVFHGVATRVEVLKPDHYLYRDVPQNFVAGRYHSWVVSPADLPNCLEVSAKAEDGEIMGIHHREFDVVGVQYHPESVLTEYGLLIIENWIKH